MDQLDAIAHAGERDPALRALAARIMRDAGANQRRRAELALAAVQALPWRDESPSVERYQAVSRTLRLGGNCHDRSPVLVALLRVLGVPAHDTWMNQPKSERNHVMVSAVIDGADCSAGVCRRGWCWAETTIKGARLCEDPYDAERRLDGANGLGTVPEGVAAPPARGQRVVTAVERPMKRPSTMVHRPRRVLVAATPAPVSTLPMPVAQPTPQPTRTATIGKPSGAFGDPCVNAWRVFVGASSRANAPAPFPPTGAYVLWLAGGRRMPNPAGAASGFTYAGWRAIPLTSNRLALRTAVQTWARRVGVDPRQIDGGAMSDWLDAATIAMDTAAQAAFDDATRALAAYRSCRASGSVDAAAVVASVGSCAAWAAMRMPMRHASLRGYLAGRGFNAALPDASVHAMSATVDRYCAAQAARVRTVATAPAVMRGLVLRR